MMKLINELKTPSFLQQLQWIGDPVGYMKGAQEHYPDIFKARIIGFGGTLIFVQNPQAIQQILTNDRKQFSAPGELNKILKPLLGDYSVMTLGGERHRQQRQMLMPPFHGGRMQVYSELICNLTKTIFSKLPKDKPFSAQTAMQDISLQVILEVVFGLYEGERYQLLKQMIARMLNIFRSPLPSAFLFFPSLQRDLGAWSPWGNFVRQRQQIDELLYAQIRERQEQPNLEGTDILSLLLSARDQEGNSMTDQELRDELMTLMLAGHDTTATATSWALYWVHHLPEVREKLLKELETLGDSPDPMTISRLPYLSAVCNESLRIHPVAMLTFPRVVEEPVELLEYELEPGTPVVGCIYLLHHREDLYPDPKQFRPERFLERQYSPYEFMPFGSGARRCIGEALAQFEMKLVLATVLSHYQLELVEPKQVKPQRRGVTLAPAGGVKMVITKTYEKRESPLALVVG